MHGTVVHMILRIMLRPFHMSFALLSQNILLRLLVINLRDSKFRTIPATKYRPAVCTLSHAAAARRGPAPVELLKPSVSCKKPGNQVIDAREPSR